MSEKDISRYFKKSITLERAWQRLLTPKQVDTLYDILTTDFLSFDETNKNALREQIHVFEKALYAMKPIDSPNSLSDLIDSTEHEPFHPLLYFYGALQCLHEGNLYLQTLMHAQIDNWGYASPDRENAKVLKMNFRYCQKARLPYWPFDKRQLKDLRAKKQ